MTMQTAPQYLQLNKGGAMARLSILRMNQTAYNMNRPESAQYATWKQARKYGFNNWAAAYCALSQGRNGSDSVWYSHTTGDNFRIERAAHEFIRLGHTGHYTDPHCESKAFGIVAMLTHGRFIAGYEWSDNGERVYFDSVYTDESDAARMSDEHARVFAENQMEYELKADAAHSLENKIEAELSRLTECLALRNCDNFSYARAEARELIESIRADRETLQTEFANL